MAASVSPTDHALGAPGATLATRDYGGDGPPLVLVHGLSSNLAIWDHVAPKLAKAHRVVAYDQRAHGLSSNGDGDFTFPALFADLAAVIDHFGLVEPVIVGHSWGASVALEHAAGSAGCPGVVCVDGGVIDMQGLLTTWEQAEPLLTPPKLIGPEQKVLDRIRTEQSFLPWERLEPVVRRGRIATEDGLTRPRLAFDDHMRIAYELWAQRTWEVYARVTAPVMLVLARGIERSPSDGSAQTRILREQGFVAIKQLCSERLVEIKPDVRVEWLDSVHDIPLAHPDELYALIEDFVATL